MIDITLKNMTGLLVLHDFWLYSGGTRGACMCVYVCEGVIVVSTTACIEAYSSRCVCGCVCHLSVCLFVCLWYFSFVIAVMLITRTF